MANREVEILTGVRPTGSLTIANYLGAIKPIIDLQNEDNLPVIFVADLHAITDNEPSSVKNFIHEIVIDYLSLGIDYKKTKIFLQSDIAKEISLITLFLSRLTNVAELLRVPTLKEKLKDNQKPENANALLMLYPVMMSADILSQRAEKVPVGEDQLAHLEISRELARRFNKKYGQTFPVPQPLQVNNLRILSLSGQGKMSKTLPNGAIFLTDSKEVIAQKIKRAETAVEGTMTDKLESHILIAKNLAKNKSQLLEIDSIVHEHQKGKAVMGEFKKLLTQIVQEFIVEFQEKRDTIIKNKSLVEDILTEGKKIAQSNSQETLKRMIENMEK